MKLESTALILDFDPYQTRTEAEATHNLGEKVELADGRIFRFAKAGASNITRGYLQLAPAPITNHHNMACDAAAIGAFEVNVTPGATGGNANIYSEGYLGINDVDGEGSVYKIKSHAAITSSTEFTVNLFDPIVNVALTANSEATLVHNSYNGVVEAAVEEQQPAGVPLRSISAGDYGWLQTRGIAAVLSGEDYAVGSNLTQHASTAGALDETDTTYGTSMLFYVVGKAIVAGINTEFRPVFLTID